MKRSEMIGLIREYLNNVDFSYLVDEEELDDEADFLLSIIEKHGMLPPNCTVKLIPDELRGGQKHSPTERKWDDENE